MITHLVFFNMLLEANEASGEENAQQLVNMLQALPAKIAQIKELEAGLDINRSPMAFDVGLMTKFSSREDLEIYQAHPDHQNVVAFVQQTTSERAVVDYEV